MILFYMTRDPDKHPHPEREGELPFELHELAALSDRDQKVLRMRYGLSSEGRRYTLKAVGNTIGVTRERVRRIQNEALAKLRRRRTEQLGPEAGGGDADGSGV